VRIADAACPFCGGQLDDTFRETSARAAAARTAPRRRLGRAALFAFGGAALASTSGCYEHHLRDGEIPEPPVPVIDAGVDSGGIGLLYGAPPEPEPLIDAGGPEMPDAAVIAAYGGPIPVPVPSPDAGASTDEDAGAPANLYGAAPAPDEAALPEE
jgi:hypothetical protein